VLPMTSELTDWCWSLEKLDPTNFQLRWESGDRG
jgi:hypothetical protein